MTSPTLDGAPTADELAAVECPFQRAARITEVARMCGTLPAPLHRLRRTTLAELRAIRDEASGEAKYSLAVIAERVGISKARVFQLTRPFAQEA